MRQAIHSMGRTLAAGDFLQMTILMSSPAIRTPFLRDISGFPGAVRVSPTKESVFFGVPLSCSGLFFLPRFPVARFAVFFSISVDWVSSGRVNARPGHFCFAVCSGLNAATGWQNM
jgi:hypothetical protein